MVLGRPCTGYPCPEHLLAYGTMNGMRVDHVVYAAEHDGVRATAERLAKLIGVRPVDGGVHPRFGTRNVILPLAHERYVEHVEVLDHPRATRRRSGRVVRARSEAGGGWLGWVVEVDDIAEQEVAPRSRGGHRQPAPSRRCRAARRQLGVKGLQADPQLPFFIAWEAGTPHPSEDADTEVTIESLTIAGDPPVRDWLGLPADYTSSSSTSRSSPRTARRGPHGRHLRRCRWARSPSDLPPTPRAPPHPVGALVVVCEVELGVQRRSRRLSVTTSTLERGDRRPGHHRVRQAGDRERDSRHVVAERPHEVCRMVRSVARDRSMASATPGSSERSRTMPPRRPRRRARCPSRRRGRPGPGRPRR